MKLPINALCIAVAGCLFAYFTDSQLFVLAAVPLAALAGWAEMKNDARREDEQSRIASDFNPVNEDDAMERRLAQFRKALHG